MKVALKAAWDYLRSPEATRLEAALASGVVTAVFEAVRVAIGHP